MRTNFAVLAGPLVGAVGMTVLGVAAQEQRCASRVIEETVKKVASGRLGPSNEVRLQSWATIGREPVVRVDVIDVSDLRTTPLGPSCTASMNVWREDTQETFRAVMQFTILDNAIQVNSLEKQ